MLERIRVVLVRPRRGGNVGSVARAMKNMGLGDLVVVAPRTRVGRVGERMAAHAGDVLARRRTVATLADAIADCHLVVGTVGRPTTPPDSPAEPRTIAAEVVAASRRGSVALVFGPEDHGLSNAELGLCQRTIRIPTSDDYPSLNLAQAVAVCAYEVLLASLSGEAPPQRGTPAPRGSTVAAPDAAADAAAMPMNAAEAGRRGRAARREPESDAQRPATAREREEMIEHLEQALGAIGFLSAQNPVHIVRDVRSLFARSGVTVRDVRVWRGIARQVLWSAGRAAPRDDRADVIGAAEAGAGSGAKRLAAVSRRRAAVTADGRVPQGSRSPRPPRPRSRRVRPGGRGAR